MAPVAMWHPVRTHIVGYRAALSISPTYWFVSAICKAVREHPRGDGFPRVSIVPEGDQSPASACIADELRGRWYNLPVPLVSGYAEAEGVASTW
jgi:hypothetical protein